ncbi:MAG: dehydrogenase [Planctomycetaceae bacterium]|nr:dehydrogenase [Planctomycetaceae bacterium]
MPANIAPPPTFRRALALGYASLLGLGLGLMPSPAAAAEEFIPRKQTKPPTLALSPAEAIRKMTVPAGFTVELVAAEPAIANPVAMTFDERGRIWITESFEYPRRQAGPGRDRVKILEDADGDGSAEKVTTFAEGLNIPSGIAVGAGGVWVANAPDILFYPDADRDGVADGVPQVVVTGFGRDDTHELPNSLTWGPDGWLYGLNGVFNAGHVRYGKDNPNFAKAEAEKHPGWKLTCAMFRIHPRTREFQIFCEGTSNPWGIAFNDNGDAFISACVIDHLWHLVETGYYHRQGGPYPPHTWKLESIVDYKHQMAAYCGITWFDSDAYPAEYRNKLYMGNIHGGCINVDGLVRNGATYKGVKHDDFLTANDVWFMPVVQKVGPDGCLYILDWYDRYHCYQDANYDPPGVDRAKGRLYRVRYQETPRAPKFDLAQETDDQLIDRLASLNVFLREQAQRVLAERLAAKSGDSSTSTKLQAMVADSKLHRETRLHALWTLIGSGLIDDAFLASLLDGRKSVDPTIVAWSARAAGDLGSNSAAVRDGVRRLAETSPPESTAVALVAGRKLLGSEAAYLLINAAARPIDPRSSVVHAIAWQNLRPLMATEAADLPNLVKAELGKIVARSSTANDRATALIGVGNLAPRLVDYYLADGDRGKERLAQLLIDLLRHGRTPQVAATADRFIEALAKRIPDGGFDRDDEVRQSLHRALLEYSSYAEQSAVLSTSSILCAWKDDAAIETMRIGVLEAPLADADRITALTAWASSNDSRLVDSIPPLLQSSPQNTPPFRRRLLEVLIGYEAPEVATQVLSVYAQLEDELKPAAVELLTSRDVWAKQLLDAVDSGTIPKDAVNVNQVRKLLKLGDKELTSRVEANWGKLRTDRNPQREQVVNKMRDLVRNGHGDAVRGQAVFSRLCGQCHKIHGQGQDVGPDITVNGRSNFEQLLSNVFDPSLVIGGAYQPRIVSTGDGRVLTGLLVEDSPQRVVLKLQGGKLETIARDNIDEVETSKLSLMPEGVETQYKPQEIVDLFAFLRLDKPPTDPAAKTLTGFAELDEAWNRK